MGFHLKFMWLTKTLRELAEIVIAGAGYICLLKMKQLQLAQTMHMTVETVVIGSEYAQIKWNSCHWFSLCAFQLK